MTARQNPAYRNNVVSLFGRVRREARDWTQSELAQFYRVEAVLLQSGIDVEPARGVTDEGDPWFAFCHSTSGDVFVHFARIDGLYIVESAAMKEPLTEFNFDTLVSRLANAHPLLLVEPKKGEVTRLYMHPAALLVSAVAVLFFKTAPSEAAEAGTEAPPNRISELMARQNQGGTASQHILSDLQSIALISGIAALPFFHGDKAVFTIEGVEGAKVVAELQAASSEGERREEAEPVGRAAAADTYFGEATASAATMSSGDAITTLGESEIAGLTTHPGKLPEIDKATAKASDLKEREFADAGPALAGDDIRHDLVFADIAEAAPEARLDAAPAVQTSGEPTSEAPTPVETASAAAPGVPAATSGVSEADAETDAQPAPKPISSILDVFEEKPAAGGAADEESAAIVLTLEGISEAPVTMVIPDLTMSAGSPEEILGHVGALVEAFLALMPNPEVTVDDHRIVLFDSAIREAGAGPLEIHADRFLFADGTDLSLIGLQPVPLADLFVA